MGTIIRQGAAGPETDWRAHVHAERWRARAGVRVKDVHLQRVGKGQWRVLNAALEPADVHALLGFVERVDACFDVTFLSEPGTIHRFSGQDAARRAFASRDAATAPGERVSVETGTFGPEAVPAWLHRPKP